MSSYRIVRTQNTVYLDRSGSAVNGYLVTIELTEYSEQLQFPVPNLQTSTVDSAAKELVAQRDALAKLGGTGK